MQIDCPRKRLSLPHAVNIVGRVKGFASRGGKHRTSNPSRNEAAVAEQNEDGVGAFGGSGFREILCSFAFAVKLGEAGGKRCELKAACAAAGGLEKGFG